jgi:hypothetical protein
MKTTLKFSIFLAVLVSAVAFGGAGHALSGIVHAGPLMRRDDYLELQHMFYVWAFYSAIGIGVTLWLWWTYRREYSS